MSAPPTFLPLRLEPKPESRDDSFRGFLSKSSLTGHANIADVRLTPDSGRMRCYHVLVHGRLKWSNGPPAVGVAQPLGFYCHRYVLAADEQSAEKIAFERVGSNFERSDRQLSDGSATLTMEAEEICLAPFHKLLTPDNRGHTFYNKDD